MTNMNYDHKVSVAETTADYGSLASDIKNSGMFHIGFDKDTEEPVIMPYGGNVIWKYNKDVLTNILNDRESLELTGVQYDTLQKIYDSYDEAYKKYLELKNGEVSEKVISPYKWRVTITVDHTDGDYEVQCFKLNNPMELISRLPLDIENPPSGFKFNVEFEVIN